MTNISRITFSNVCGTSNLLIVRMSSIRNINLDGGVLAQAIELKLDDDSIKFAMGLSFVSGEPMGMLAHHTKNEIRRWGRIDFVYQTARRLLGDQMIGFTVVSNYPGMMEQLGFVQHNYRLNDVDEDLGDGFEQERLLLMKQMGIQPDDRASDSADT